MAIRCEFNSAVDGLVNASFVSPQGKTVVFFITDEERVPYSLSAPLNFAFSTKDIWGGVLSVHPVHKKSGYIKFQERVRSLTGWKIGILDIEKMIQNFNIWKLHLI